MNEKVFNSADICQTFDFKLYSFIQVTKMLHVAIYNNVLLRQFGYEYLILTQAL